MECKAYLASITGTVQGVGMRPCIYKIVSRMDINGWVLNSSRGVELAVYSTQEKLFEIISEIKFSLPPLAKIDNIEINEIKPERIKNVGFKIIESHDDIKKVKISPDMASCSNCIDEYNSSDNFRYKHPFINCVDCGPRVSILKGLPYDRVNTTMSSFSLCDTCGGEYIDPYSRRYHAQPISCKRCGPKLMLNSKVIPYQDIILETANAIMKGGIVCLKGISGYHYVVDALNNDAIVNLRNKKKRYIKPFALLFKDVSSVKKYLKPTSIQLNELVKQYRPIVLINKKTGCLLPEVISPRLGVIGAMLPSWPFHYELFQALDTDVLVMTSANSSGHPLASHDDDVLGSNIIHDILVSHDREIIIPQDDSLVKVFEYYGKEFNIFLRKGRGMAPYFINGQYSTSGNIALGAFHKNTMSLQIEDSIIVSGHLGDINNRTFNYIKSHALNYAKIYDLIPHRSVLDSHPLAVNVVPTKEVIKVQHHHAHLVSCMVDNNLREACIGVIFDGTGHGPDNSIWGGEFLFGDYESFNKLGGLKSFFMPSGEAHIKDLFKMMVSILNQSDTISQKEIRNFLEEKGLAKEYINLYLYSASANACNIRTSSAGRLLDALAALAGVNSKVEYEGQAPLELESLLDDNLSLVKHVEFPVYYESDGVFSIDFRSLVDFVFNNRNDISISEASRIIHSTFVSYIVAGSCISRDITNCNRVVLSGGIFQNGFILANSYHALRKEGFEVYIHNTIPCNDAGVSIGQLVISGKVSI